MIELRAVNVGLARVLSSRDDERVWSAISKQPVEASETLWLSFLDLAVTVSQPRWPCFKLALHRDRADIQRRLRQTGRTGWYLRVLQPGAVPVAGPITVAQHDPRQVTVEHAHLAMADTKRTDRARIQAIVDHPSLAAQWREPLAERLARQS